jgi:hypothetical protein
MLRKALASAALAGALAASACESGPTPYQPGEGQSARGYSEQQIESNRWRINFRGNSLTDRETVETYMLFRAAELTLQKGFDTFTIVDRDTDRRSRIRESGGYYDTRLSYVYFVPRVGWVPMYDTYYQPGRLDQVTQYAASAEILLARGPKGSDPNAFDARDVSQNLGPRIARPPE